MSVSSTTRILRAELRRKTVWLVAVAVLLAGLDLLMLPIPPGSDWRSIGAIVAALVDAVLVTLVGGWLLRRPVLSAVETL